MSGWIKLYRKTLKSDMYQSLNSKQRDVMMALLMMANHETKKWEWQGKIFEVKPGQMVTSLESIKKNCASDVSIKNIRTALEKLETWGFLTNESAKTGRLITIVNWGVYQDKEEGEGKETDKQSANNRQRAGRQPATNKNDKEEKKKELRSRFSDKELEIVDAYFDTIRQTRKSGKIAESIIINEMEYWLKFDKEVVLYALKKHTSDYPDKSEKYTRGIMRNTTPEEVQRRKKKNNVVPFAANGWEGSLDDEDDNIDFYLSLPVRDLRAIR